MSSEALDAIIVTLLSVYDYALGSVRMRLAA